MTDEEFEVYIAKEINSLKNETKFINERLSETEIALLSISNTFRKCAYFFLFCQIAEFALLYFKH